MPPHPVVLRETPDQTAEPPPPIHFKRQSLEKEPLTPTLICDRLHPYAYTPRKFQRRQELYHALKEPATNTRRGQPPLQNKYDRNSKTVRKIITRQHESPRRDSGITSTTPGQKGQPHYLNSETREPSPEYASSLRAMSAPNNNSEDFLMRGARGSSLVRSSSEGTGSDSDDGIVRPRHHRKIRVKIHPPGDPPKFSILHPFEWAWDRQDYDRDVERWDKHLEHKKEREQARARRQAVEGRNDDTARSTPLSRNSRGTSRRHEEARRRSRPSHREEEDVQSGLGSAIVSQIASMARNVLDASGQAEREREGSQTSRRGGDTDQSGPSHRSRSAQQSGPTHVSGSGRISGGTDHSERSRQPGGARHSGPSGVIGSGRLSGGSDRSRETQGSRETTRLGQGRSSGISGRSERLQESGPRNHSSSRHPSGRHSSNSHHSTGEHPSGASGSPQDSRRASSSSKRRRQTSTRLTFTNEAFLQETPRYLHGSTAAVRSEVSDEEPEPNPDDGTFTISSRSGRPISRPTSCSMSTEHAPQQRARQQTPRNLRHSKTNGRDASHKPQLSKLRNPSPPSTARSASHAEERCCYVSSHQLTSLSTSKGPDQSPAFPAHEAARRAWTSVAGPASGVPRSFPHPLLGQVPDKAPCYTGLSQSPSPSPSEIPLPRSSDSSDSARSISSLSSSLSSLSSYRARSGSSTSGALSTRSDVAETDTAPANPDRGQKIPPNRETKRSTTLVKRIGELFKKVEMKEKKGGRYMRDQGSWKRRMERGLVLEKGRQQDNSTGRGDGRCERDDGR